MVRVEGTAREDQSIFQYDTTEAMAEEAHRTLTCLCAVAKVDESLQERACELCDTLTAVTVDDLCIVTICDKTCFWYISWARVSQPDELAIRRPERSHSVSAQAGDRNDVELRIVRTTQGRESDEVVIHMPIASVTYFRASIACERCAKFMFAVCR